MKTYLPIGAAVIAMAVVAYFQGSLSERWAKFPELKVYAKQVSEVPKKVGEWTWQSDEKNDPKIMKEAGAAAALGRQYQNEKGETVGIFVICGRPQDLKHHTPERCYPAAGFEQTSTPTPEEIETADGKQAGFMTATFTRVESGAQTAQRVYWSFTTDGDWKAPDDFRWAFGGTRAMYKVYVTAPVGFREKEGEESAAKELIRELIPALNRAFQPAYDSELAMTDGKATASDATIPAAEPKTDAKPAAEEKAPAAAAPEAKSKADADAK
jgi:hypothetical protein